jgi:hypothetical protein
MRAVQKDFAGAISAAGSSLLYPTTATSRLKPSVCPHCLRSWSPVDLQLSRNGGAQSSYSNIISAEASRHHLTFRLRYTPQGVRIKSCLNTSRFARVEEYAKNMPREIKLGSSLGFTLTSTHGLGTSIKSSGMQARIHDDYGFSRKKGHHSIRSQILPQSPFACLICGIFPRDRWCVSSAERRSCRTLYVL